MIEILNTTRYDTDDLIRLVKKCEIEWEKAASCKDCDRSDVVYDRPGRFAFVYGSKSLLKGSYYDYVSQITLTKGKLRLISVLDPKDWPLSPLEKLAMAGKGTIHAPKDLIRQLTECISDSVDLPSIKESHESPHFRWETKFKLKVNDRAEYGSRKILKDIKLIQKRDELRSYIQDEKNNFDYYSNSVRDTQRSLKRQLRGQAKAKEGLCEAKAKFKAFIKDNPKIKFPKAIKRKK
jgi:hypothetical protein